jgi:hypothetical protein
MKLLLKIILLLTPYMVYSQTIFTETFNEGSGSSSGTDETGGVSWTSSCGGCISGDIWEEFNGEFHNNDSNGPALWTTGTIDISTCSSVEISFDYRLSGTFEGCGTGCNSVDWISLEYNIDGTPYNPTNSYFCAGGCADLNVVWDGSDGNNGTYISGPIPTGGGNSLEFEIGSQTWAGTEHIYIDNITVACYVVMELDTTKAVVTFPTEEGEERVILTIYNVLGQELYKLINGKEVNLSHYNGIIIIRYLDGTLRKVKVL